MITIHLQALNNKTTPCTIEETATYEDLHKQLCESLSLPESTNVRFVFKGKIFKAGKQLQEYGIVDGSIIVYVISKKTKETKETDVASEPTPEATAPAPESTDPATEPASEPLPELIEPTGQQLQLPPLESLMPPESLAGLRSTVLSIAVDQIISNRQLLMSILQTSPAYRQLISRPDGFVIALIVSHPHFMSPNVLRNMGPDLSDESDQSDDSDGKEIDQLSVAEKSDIDEIMQIFPTKSRGEVVRLYIDCSKNKEDTINLMLIS